jgi:hypothetical protein
LGNAAHTDQETTAPAGNPRNTLADYEPGLVNKIHAFGPLFSDAIPRTTRDWAQPPALSASIQDQLMESNAECSAVIIADESHLNALEHLL